MNMNKDFIEVSLYYVCLRCAHTHTHKHAHAHIVRVSHVINLLVRV